VEREACGMNLAPTASTTAMLALGDALAIAVSLRKGFRADDFAELHPGGKLGKRLAKVRDLMHAGENVPVVALATPMKDVIYEMSRKKLGITTVQGDGQLRGVISDGDLRRLLEREGGAALDRTAGEAMNAHPQTIASSELAAKALALLEERKITSLVVVDDAGHVEGVVHLHDLWGVELI
jgi:arabinose-5-phosphate isomerase